MLGCGSDGYLTNARFLQQMEKAMKIGDIKYPSDKFSKVWIFDQSNGHHAFSEDALNVHKRNVGPRCAQPRMRNTIWDGKVQQMVMSDGRPKGMRIVLQECGVDNMGMKVGDMCLVLGNHSDFKNEKLHLSKGKGSMQSTS